MMFCCVFFIFVQEVVATLSPVRPRRRRLGHPPSPRYRLFPHI